MGANFMGIRVGIDLGSTNTKIAYVDDNGQAVGINNREGMWCTPSVVYFEDREVIVGDVAKEMSILKPENAIFEIVKLIREHKKVLHVEKQNITLEETIAYIIKKVVSDASYILDDSITDATVTIPNYFGAEEIEIIEKASRIAGLENIRFLLETSAAIFAYGIDYEQDRTLLVYNLGGKNFDVSIVKVGNRKIVNVLTDVDYSFGCDEWDNTLIQHLKERFCFKTGFDGVFDDYAQQEIILKAEKLKQQLSVREEVPVLLDVAGLRERIIVKKSTFEELTQCLLDKTIKITNSLVEKAKFQGYTIDEILLVGGASRMPMIREALYQKYCIEPQLNYPELVLAKGAAIYSSLCDVKETKNEPIIKHKMNIKESPEESNKMFLKAIATSNGIIQTISIDDWYIPFDQSSVKKIFSFIDYGSGEVNLTLYECRRNDKNNNLHLKDHNLVTISFTNQPKLTPSIIQVEILLKINGLLSVTCEENNKKRVLKIDVKTDSYLKCNRIIVV